RSPRPGYATRRIARAHGTDEPRERFSRSRPYRGVVTRYAIVGGGILGCALARELLSRSPGAEVTLLEKESEVGAHQSGHNSGVVHAGLYYTPGSLKEIGRATCRERE